LGAFSGAKHISAIALIFLNHKIEFLFKKLSISHSHNATIKEETFSILSVTCIICIFR